MESSNQEIVSNLCVRHPSPQLVIASAAQIDKNVHVKNVSLSILDYFGRGNKSEMDIFVGNLRKSASTGVGG